MAISIYYKKNLFLHKILFSILSNYNDINKCMINLYIRELYLIMHNLIKNILFWQANN